MGTKGEIQQRTLRESEIPGTGRVVTATEFIIEGVPWRVSIRLMPDHFHRFWVECDGHLVSEHCGGLTRTWPGEGFPEAVEDAIYEVAERLSWS